jgi:hypothetical protein
MKTLLSNQYIKNKVLAMTILLSSCLLIPAVQANLLLDVDLSVENTITISALDGSSLITESSDLFEGVYLADFFADSFTSSIGDSLISSSITSAVDTSGLFNDLFHFDNDPGLNLFSFDAGVASFTAGELAFVGQGTWTISEVAYQSAINGPLSGSLFFPADSVNDISDLSAIGSWAVSNIGDVEVPGPSVVLLFILGLAGVALSRKTKKV